MHGFASHTSTQLWFPHCGDWSPSGQMIGPLFQCGTPATLAGTPHMRRQSTRNTENAPTLISSVPSCGQSTRNHAICSQSCTSTTESVLPPLSFRHFRIDHTCACALSPRERLHVIKCSTRSLIWQLSGMLRTHQGNPRGRLNR